MLMVSLSRSLFSPAPEVASRSDPAKSTELISLSPYHACRNNTLPKFSIASHFSSVRGLTPFTLRVKTECERDDRSFIRVAATARRDRARSSRVATERGLLSGTDQISRVTPRSLPTGLTADGVRHRHLAIFVVLDLVFLGVELARSEQIVDLTGHQHGNPQHRRI